MASLIEYDHPEAKEIFTEKNGFEYKKYYFINSNGDARKIYIDLSLYVPYVDPD